MNGTIGCIGLIGIAVFIVLLALWSRRSRAGVARFYEKYKLVVTSDGPPNVMEAIGVANAICRRGSLKLASGSEIPFYWWEWFTSSTLFVGNTPQGSINSFLAISFPPNSISDEFEQKAIQAKEHKQEFSTKLKNAVALDTTTPIRVEKLPDGTFVIFWQVLQQASIMEDKIEWLRSNVTVPKTSRPGVDFHVVAADVGLTLMMMQQTGDYLPADVMTYKYYFIVPGTFWLDLVENTRQLIDQVYNEHNQTFKLREPNDPNYIAVVSVEPTHLLPSQYALSPWLEANMPVWETSNCIKANASGFKKIERGDFGGHIGIQN